MYICILASNLLPHYLAKFECSAVRLYSNISHHGALKMTNVKMQDMKMTDQMTRREIA